MTITQIKESLKDSIDSILGDYVALLSTNYPMKHEALWYLLQGVIEVIRRLLPAHHAQDIYDYKNKRIESLQEVIPEWRRFI